MYPSVCVGSLLSAVLCLRMVVLSLDMLAIQAPEGLAKRGSWKILQSCFSRDLNLQYFEIFARRRYVEGIDAEHLVVVDGGVSFTLCWGRLFGVDL